VIKTNLNSMGSRPPMALSERPQHTAPCPLLALYMESSNGWSGLPVAQYGNLGSRHCLYTLLGALYGMSQKGQPRPPMALSARPRKAAHRPHRHCIENLKKAGLNLAMTLYCNLGHNSMGFP